MRDPSRSLRDGALVITLPSGYTIYSQVTIDVLDQVCRAHGFTVDIPWRDLTAGQREVVLNGSDRIRIPYGKHPLSSRLRWKGITPKPREEGVYKGILPVMEQILRQKRNRNILRFVRTMACRACGGTRLRAEARAVTIDDRTHCRSGRPRDRAISPHGSDRSSILRAATRRRARRSGARSSRRAALLVELGLGYLTLDRASASLSGGEAQRHPPRGQAGIGLRNLLYVLDEPSMGLHDRDTRSLIGLLRRSARRGEHRAGRGARRGDDPKRRLDRGHWTGAGRDGRDPSAAGSRFLTAVRARRPSRPQQDAAAGGPGRTSRPVPPGSGCSGASAILARRRRPGRGPLSIRGVTRNNLKSIDVDFQLGAFNVITGVSGAGKSSLVEELISRHRERAAAGRGSHSAPSWKSISRRSDGRRDRTRPPTPGCSTTSGTCSRRLPEARTRGLERSHFSFNVAGGRCEACEGAGVIDVGMHFLGTVEVPCESCGGRRFHADTLSVRYEGLTIHDVLEQTVGEAARLFARHPRTGQDSRRAR